MTGRQTFIMCIKKFQLSWERRCFILEMTLLAPGSGSALIHKVILYEVRIQLCLLLFLNISP